MSHSERSTKATYAAHQPLMGAESELSISQSALTLIREQQRQLEASLVECESAMNFWDKGQPSEARHFAGLTRLKEVARLLCEAEQEAKEAATCLKTERARQDVDELAVWNEFDKQNSPNFFRDIAIAKDGGFSEVKELWTPVRWVTAIVTLFFVVSNLYYTLWFDFTVILSTRQCLHAQKRGLTITILAAWFQTALGVAAEDQLCGYKIIAVIEICLATYMISQTVWHSLVALTAKTEYTKWRSSERVWWNLIPDLYTFSAMRLLHFVSPQVFMAEVAIVVAECRGIAWFVCTRLLFLFIGFESFLLKCREYQETAHQDSGFIWHVWSGVLFMKQILGIVQLSMFVRDRIFNFVFAGEDAIMQEREVAMMNVWNAMLVRKIWRTFSIPKSMVLMLSFDDTDLQKLVINEKRWRTPANETHTDSRGSTDEGESVE